MKDKCSNQKPLGDQGLFYNAQNVEPIAWVLTPSLVASLRAARQADMRIGDAPLFPSAIKRHIVGTWWKQLERRARLPRVTGRGWHSLRRNFATDLVDEPLSVVRDLGGWKGTATLMKCYQRPDESRMSAALERRAQRAAV